LIFIKKTEELKMAEKQGINLQKIWLIILVASAIFSAAGTYVVNAERSKDNKKKLERQENKINDLTLMMREMKVHFEHTNKSLEELKNLIKVLVKK